MACVAKSSTKPKGAKEAGEHRGEVLDVVRALLAEGREEDVLGVVTKLVAQNSELERRLAQLLARGHKNEGVSAGQLLLFLNELTGESANDARPVGETGTEMTEANDALRAASGIDDPRETEPETEPKRPPPLRKPPPAHLPRAEASQGDGASVRTRRKPKFTPRVCSSRA